MSVALADIRLRVEGLSKHFSGVPVLCDVSFEAYAGEVLGLVGENGSGKSTTLNILAGVIAPDAGNILMDGAKYAPTSRRASELAGVAYIQQELNIFPTLTVAENLLLGRFPRRLKGLPFISPGKLNREALAWLHEVRLDVRPSSLAGRLSPGERQLLEIARGLSTNARIIILDEPTTSLSARECARLIEIVERLRAKNIAVLLVSHALEDVLRVSDRLLVLRDGGVTLRARRGEVDANGLVRAMVGHSIDTLFPPWSARASAADPVLRVEEVNEPGVISQVSFAVRAGEILGIAGLMGSGRTELARILFGLDTHRSGRIFVGKRLLPSGDVSAALAAGMAFLSEDRRHDGLMIETSVADNIGLAAWPLFVRRGGRLRAKALAAAIKAVVNRLNIKGSALLSAPVGSLSGGNQQKVVLGRWLLRSPTVFILDEPTRGVDVGSKEEIYRLLVEMTSKGMALVVISSELDELIGLSDRILVMRQGKVCAAFERAQFSSEAILKAAFGQEQAA